MATVSQVSAQKHHNYRAELPDDSLALHSSGRGLLCIFALVLAQSLSPSLGSPVQDGLAVLVHLELDDDQLAGVDTDINGGPVGLLPLDPLDVDPELLPVALDYLAHLLTLVVTSDHLDFIILPDGHGSDSILGSQLLREGSRHQASSDMRRSRKVTLPGFGTVRGHVLVQLHLLL